jgi:NAD+ synthase
MVKQPLTLDEPTEEEKIISFVRKTVGAARAHGVVLGLSGGIDSAVVCALCAEALGEKKVLGILMPSDSTPPQDEADARTLASLLGIRTKEVAISNVVGELLAGVKVKGTKLARANLQARARMTILYFYANTLGLLVAGTGDRSEVEIGFFTKYGDGGADFLPIAHLYKTQVRRLASHLGVLPSIVRKPSSPQLWLGHKATDELPADYDRLDLVLYYLLDERLTVGEAASKAGVRREVGGKVLEMIRSSAHKRALPPSLEGR